MHDIQRVSLLKNAKYSAQNNNNDNKHQLYVKSVNNERTIEKPCERKHTAMGRRSRRAAAVAAAARPCRYAGDDACTPADWSNKPPRPPHQ